MGSFSIWHWLVILLIIGVPLALLATLSTDSRMARGEFVKRILILIGAAIASGFLAGAIETAGAIVMLIIMIAGLWSYRWAGARLQDMGHNKWMTLLFLIPLVNLVVLIWLCVAGSKVEAHDLIPGR